ncbi:MAG TPA: hypothetical protein VFV58_34820 [Blastocatellia bacterium]|jgi:hypothetical protein|nr:hypothetical protein [Blastocatellia bacterium]
MSESFDGQGAASAPDAGSSGGNVGGASQAAGTPASQPPAGGGSLNGGNSPYAPPSVPGDFDEERLLSYSRQIFGEGHEDAPVFPGKDQAKPEGEEPAPLPPEIQADLNKWQGLGEYDQVKDRLGLVNYFFSENPKDLWEGLRGADVDRVADLLDAAIDAWPQYFVEALQRGNQLPQVASVELSVLDPRHHEVYGLLTPQERYEIQMEEDPDRQYHLLESRLKELERDRMIDDHEKQFQQQRDQERQEKSQGLTNTVRDSVKHGVINSLAGRLNLTGDKAVDGEIGEALWTWAENVIVADPVNQRALTQLHAALARLDEREARRLALPLQAKVTKLIGGFLDRLGATGQGPAPQVQAAPAQKTAARQSADEPRPGDFDDRSLRKMSRSIFG